MARDAAEGYPRSARLTRARDFERALKRPDLRLAAGPLRLHAVFNRMQFARLGLVVGKKAISRAPARNRVKRIIREHFRRQRRGLTGLDAVVRVLGPVDAVQLHGQLERLFADLATRAAERSGEIVNH